MPGQRGDTQLGHKEDSSEECGSGVGEEGAASRGDKPVCYGVCNQHEVLCSAVKGQGKIQGGEEFPWLFQGLEQRGVSSRLRFQQLVPESTQSGDNILQRAGIVDLAG